MQLRSDKDRGDGTARYVLSGEGAGTIFRIDEKSGDLHATQRLDREEKASYTLQAQAFNKITGLPLEPATEFIVKIHDINDNEPKFTKAVYTASVPEMSDIGEWMKITFSLGVVIWSAFTVMMFLEGFSTLLGEDLDKSELDFDKKKIKIVLCF